MAIPQSGSYITIPMLKNKYKGEITDLTLAVCLYVILNLPGVMSPLFCFSQP